MATRLERCLYKRIIRTCQIFDRHPSLKALIHRQKGPDVFKQRWLVDVFKAEEDPTKWFYNRALMTFLQGAGSTLPEDPLYHDSSAAADELTAFVRALWREPPRLWDPQRLEELMQQSFQKRARRASTALSNPLAQLADPHPAQTRSPGVGEVRGFALCPRSLAQRGDRVSSAGVDAALAEVLVPPQAPGGWPSALAPPWPWGGLPRGQVGRNERISAGLRCLRTLSNLLHAAEVAGILPPEVLAHKTLNYSPPGGKDGEGGGVEEDEEEEEEEPNFTSYADLFRKHAHRSPAALWPIGAWKTEEHYGHPWDSQAGEDEEMQKMLKEVRPWPSSKGDSPRSGLRSPPEIASGMFLLGHPVLTSASANYLPRPVVFVYHHCHRRQETQGLIVNKYCWQRDEDGSRETEVKWHTLRTAYPRLSSGNKVCQQFLKHFGSQLVRYGGPTNRLQMAHSQPSAGGVKVPGLEEFWPKMPLLHHQVGSEGDGGSIPHQFVGDQPVYVGVDLPPAFDLVEKNAARPSDFHIFVGLSYWPERRLQQEILWGDWIPVKAPPALALSGGQYLWYQMMEALGKPYAEYTIWPEKLNSNNLDLCQWITDYGT